MAETESVIAGSPVFPRALYVGLRIIENVQLPKETRIRVIGGDIVNSPVSVTDTERMFSEEEQVYISLDPAESSYETYSSDMRKKRGHKPKGSNAIGSRSLSRMNADRMEMEDDDLDRLDPSEEQEAFLQDSQEEEQTCGVPSG